MPTDDFLAERDPITWSAPDGFPASLTPAGLFTQNAANGLEVVLVTAVQRPNAATMRQAWTKRRAGRASPVLLVAFYPTGEGQRVSLCGPVGELVSVRHGVEVSQTERVAAAALEEPSHHAATRFLLTYLPELDSQSGSRTPGLRNVGLAATQELRAGVPARDDWAAAGQRARPLLSLRGRQLVEGLGFTVETLGTNTSMLTVADRPRAVAVFCRDDEPVDASARRFEGTSPVDRALADADRHDVDWVILTRACEIRLYPAQPGIGVGRGGRAEKFVELNLALLPVDSASYLALLFSATALAPETGTVKDILCRSKRFAAKLAHRLRERVYYQTVPALAAAVAARMDHDHTGTGLKDAYEQVMVILFRLLFVAYAEDSDLLGYRTNDGYRRRSLKGLARGLIRDRQPGQHRADTGTTELWDQIHELWRTVDEGKPEWGIPAYNGGLFSQDPEVNPAGAALARLEFTDSELAPALTGLLVDEGPEGEGPVDFRSLSVREFGTIYEGLLESRLAVAPGDLTIAKAKGQYQYVPVTDRDPVDIRAGEVYLQNRSGVRKATGSYFTKPFAVEHLLDHALESALNDHIARLDHLHDIGDEAGLTQAFFDFRCADIAMGSGHFLVAALDRIETRLSDWLARHQLGSVTAELERLRATALAALGDLAAGTEIESSSLLRRQVARHCIYGVDQNLMAVELARLAIWVHTFVPGLPLSFLDHNLVHGDSLTGVGTLDEVVELFTGAGSGQSLFSGQVEELLGRAEGALRRLARTSDATKAEIDQARAAHLEAQRAVTGARALFDVITAHRAGVGALPERFDEAVFIAQAEESVRRNAVNSLQPVHFPAAFPEVFLRDRLGFDCLVGNPPWEKVVVDEKVWWGAYLPGIRSLPVQDMNREIAAERYRRRDLAAQFEADLTNAEHRRQTLRNIFSDLGTGHTDLYKAFAWRNWHLAAPGAAVGLMLPRSALSDTGMTRWRRAVLTEGTFADVTTLLNTGGWVFDDVDGRYTVGLCSLRQGRDSDPVVTLAGPYACPTAYRRRTGGETVPVSEFVSWSKTLAFPTLPDYPGALKVFRKLRAHPRIGGKLLDNSRAQGSGLRAQGSGRWPRPVQGDLNATVDKHRFVLDDGESARSESSTPPTTNAGSPSTGEPRP